MIVEKRIETKLRESFVPLHLEAHNESHKHNVPSGSESHFKVVIVSDRFEKVPLVEKHRMVYGVLNGELQGEVHALSIQTKNPPQWESIGRDGHKTPPCLGGDSQTP